MTEQQLVNEGIELMLIGMGTVFVFLTVLVFATMLMSRIVGRFPGEEPLPVSDTAGGDGGDAAPAPGVGPDVIAAVAAAVRRHRGRGGRG